MRSHALLVSMALIAGCAGSEPKVPGELADRYSIKDYAEEEHFSGRFRKAVIESKDEGLLPGTFFAEHLAATDGASCLTVFTGKVTVSMVDRDDDGAIDVYVSGGSADRTIWTRTDGWKSPAQELTPADKERLLERGQQLFDTCKALLGVTKPPAK